MRRLVSLAAIEVAVVLVASIAGGALGDLGPGTWRGEPMRRWYADASADTLLATAGLAVVVAIAGWLALATGLQALAELVPATPLRNIADRVAPTVLRSVGRTVAEVTLGASVLLAPVSISLSAGQAALALVDDQPGTATLRPVAPAQPPAESPATDSALDPVATLPVAGSATASVVVSTGDSFWSIADEVLSSHLGRPASDAETDRFWRALMERNADRLVVPGNFDLIYPGQVLALPDGNPTGDPPRLAETL